MRPHDPPDGFVQTRAEMTVHYVTTVSEVLDLALEPAKKPRANSRRKTPAVV